MSFLSCAPSVFVIGDEYEILINTEKNGIIHLEIAGEEFFEENAGILATERAYARIRVPQAALDGAKEYSVVFRETICHQAYFSKIAEPIKEVFSFKPLEKCDDIHIYHIADVHSCFDVAREAADFFGEDTDLFIMNGDIAEVEKPEDFVLVAKWLGAVAKGKIPMVFVRGNHDTRGRLSHFYTDFFPSNNKNTFFTFSIGPIAGTVLDCGEDKPDDYIYDEKYDFQSAYSGINRFTPYRKRELAFLKALKESDKPYRIAVSHICPMQTTRHPGDHFDIERGIYTAFSEELTRLGTRAMLCGHIHRPYIMKPGDGQSILAHSFPIVVGSSVRRTEDNGISFGGAAITLKNGTMHVAFTNEKKEILFEEDLIL